MGGTMKGAGATADDPDVRILHRLKPVARFHDVAAGVSRADCSVGVVVDVETTGLDRDNDLIIELAIQRLRYDAAGRILEVGQPRSWREDPGRPLDPRVSKLTRLSDADLAGSMIDEQMAVELLSSATLVVAHNAAFDRPFIERRLPAIAGKP